MSIVTPGRIVVVRLSHGWRSAAVVMTGCAEWSDGHRITAHVFGEGDFDLDCVLPTLAPEKRERVVTELLNTGARVKKPSGFVVENLPRADPNDEHSVGWFFPPREVSP